MFGIKRKSDQEKIKFQGVFYPSSRSFTREKHKISMNENKSVTKSVSNKSDFMQEKARLRRPERRSRDQSKMARDVPDHEYNRDGPRSSIQSRQLQDRLERRKRFDDLQDRLLEEIMSEVKNQKKKPGIQSQAKCSLSSSQSNSELESKNTCEELTISEPVKPSRLDSCSQVLKESSQEEVQRSLPLEDHLQLTTSLGPEPAIDSFIGENHNKLCKEISVHINLPNLFVLVTPQEEKQFGLKNVEEFCVSKSVFEKLISTFETFKHEVFLKTKSFLFDEVCDSYLDLRSFKTSFDILCCETSLNLKENVFESISNLKQVFIFSKQAFHMLRSFQEMCYSIGVLKEFWFRKWRDKHMPRTNRGSTSMDVEKVYKLTPFKSFSSKDPFFFVLDPNKDYWINWCSNDILVYDKALDGNPRILTFVLDVFENSSCTYDLSFLDCEKEQVKHDKDFVLKSRVIQGLDKQVDYGPREHLSKDRFQRRATSIIQGSPILSSFFPIAYLFVPFIIFFVTNPYPFDVGELDLSTNPFQEGGYDMILISSSHESRNRIKAIMEPKEEPPDFDFKTTNGSLSIRPTTTWTICSTHLKNTSKLNQSNQISGEEVIQLSIQAIPTLRVLDIRVFNAGFRPNLKGSSYEPNFSGNMIHQVSFDNWIHLKICSDGKDINFTNRWICLRLYCATELKIESHSPAQVRSQPETNWRFLLDLIAFQQA